MDAKSVELIGRRLHGWHHVRMKRPSLLQLPQPTTPYLIVSPSNLPEYYIDVPVDVVNTKPSGPQRLYLCGVVYLAKRINIGFGECMKNSNLFLVLQRDSVHWETLFSID